MKYLNITDCALCLNTISKDEIAVCNRCSRPFCQKCVNIYLAYYENINKKEICPTCRKNTKFVFVDKKHSIFHKLFSCFCV